MKLLKVILLFLFFTKTYSQSDELILLKGKVLIKVKEVSDVNVLNLRSQSSTVTDENQNFSVFVKVGDTLRFSSIQVVSKNLIIKQNDISKQLFVVALEPKINELEEVEIGKYNNINAVSLGILSKQPKKYTPAERRLRTAGVFKWYSPLLIPLGGMPFDGLLNSISGRTAMLKKELVVERKEKLLEKIEYLFEKEYFTDTLKIPSDYLRGFWYYAIEDENLVKALKESNKTLCKFELSRLSVEYLSIQSKEKL